VHGLEKFTAFLSRHFGPPRLFFLVAAWILALGAWATLARDVLPMEHKLEWDIPLELRAPAYAKFDSGWYLAIIEWGYGPPPPPGHPSNHAFFPLYPSIAKVLHRTFAFDGFHTALFVTYLSLFLAAPLFFREGRERQGEESAWRSVGFLLLFPTAFFLCAVYAESLFLLLALLAFRDARAGRTGRAALWGGLLGFTKASALAAVPALFLAALESPRDPAAPAPRNRLLHALAVAAAPFCAVWTWVLALGLVRGEPGLYFRSLSAWERGSSPLSGTLAWFSRAGDYFSRSVWKTDALPLLDYGAALLFLLLALRMLWRRRWADGAWALCAIGLPVSTGLAYGIPRYVLTVYPAFYELDDLFGKRPVVRAIAWTISGALLLWAAARFVNALRIA
jgi:hypothetical protein